MNLISIRSGFGAILFYVFNIQTKLLLLLQSIKIIKDVNYYQANIFRGWICMMGQFENSQQGSTILNDTVHP